MKKTSKLPAGPINSVEGQCIYLQGNDIDTDRIIPARFLKCTSFEALGSQVFADDRAEQKGFHPFDQGDNQNSSILIVNKNFGCGSSREHAPQALMRWGIRAVIGQSFAEIFYSNCLSIGIPCACILEPELDILLRELKNKPQSSYKLDVHEKNIYNQNISLDLTIEESTIEMLLSGRWDATSTLIQQEMKTRLIKESLPYINNFENSNL